MTDDYTPPLSTELLTDLGSFALDTTRHERDGGSTDRNPADDITAIRQQAERHNLEFLGKGSNRLAFRLPDGNVLKLPMHSPFRDGTEQNRVENLVWEGLTDIYTPTPEDAYDPHSPIDRFAPVLACDDQHRWIIVSHAEKVGEDIEAEDKVVAISREFPYLPADCEFLRAENIGWLNGWYRIVDYGSFIPREFVRRELPAGYRDKIGDENIA